LPTPFPESLVKTPLNILCLYDDDILSGVKTIWPWQVEILNYLGGVKSPGDPAIKAMLMAANGSGKSQMILAPFAIWMAMRFEESLTIITNASGKQLDNQALRYITRLATKVNSLHQQQFGMDVFECQYRKLKNNITESFIDMFATDEPGKAEGWHPIKHNGEFAIIVDEAKTVSDDIFQALERCTGYTRRLDVSSPGRCGGTFYVDWNREIKDIYKKKVTAFECPHIPTSEIEDKIKKYGLHDPLIRSSIFAEFSSTDEQVVLGRELVLKNINLCKKQVHFGPLRGGLDLASGGDETVLSVWSGNIEVGLHTFRNKDTSVTVLQIINAIQSYKGKLKPENIYADDGGIGRSMLDNLREKGYKVNRVLNQTRPYDITRYVNRGTELWFSFKRFIEEFQVYFLKDEVGAADGLLISQLSNRYYTVEQRSNKIILESKEKARKQNHPSPDRADAVVLAWSPLIWPVEELSGPANAKEAKRGLTPEEIIERYEQDLESEYFGENKKSSKIESYTGKESFSLSHKSIYKPTFKTYARGLRS